VPAASTARLLRLAGILLHATNRSWVPLNPTFSTTFDDAWEMHSALRSYLWIAAPVRLELSVIGTMGSKTPSSASPWNPNAVSADACCDQSRKMRWRQVTTVLIRHSRINSSAPFAPMVRTRCQWAD
jgi:hypothetical protein